MKQGRELVMDIFAPEPSCGLFMEESHVEGDGSVS